jgi:hypothetical protein
MLHIRVLRSTLGYTRHHEIYCGFAQFFQANIIILLEAVQSELPTVIK